MYNTSADEMGLAALTHTALVYTAIRIRHPTQAQIIPFDPLHPIAASAAGSTCLSTRHHLQGIWSITTPVSSLYSCHHLYKQHQQQKKYTSYK